MNADNNAKYLINLITSLRYIQFEFKLLYFSYIYEFLIVVI